jgi:hypothetical protein
VFEIVTLSNASYQAMDTLTFSVRSVGMPVDFRKAETSKWKSLSVIAQLGFCIYQATPNVAISARRMHNTAVSTRIIHVQSKYCTNLETAFIDAHSNAANITECIPVDNVLILVKMFKCKSW